MSTPERFETPAVLKLDSSVQIAAIGPHLLGFNPTESLLVTYFSEKRRFGLLIRLDLPIDIDEMPTVVLEILAHANESGFPAVHLAAVSADLDSFSEQLAQLTGTLRDLGLFVIGAGFRCGDMWRELGIDGRADDSGESLVAGEALRAVVEMVGAGKSFMASRAELEQLVVGVEPGIGAAVAEVLDTDYTSLREMVLGKSNQREARIARRGVEDGLFDFLTDKCDYPRAHPAALWIIGLSDPRIREPILWRLSRSAQMELTNTSASDADTAIDRMAWLVRVSPTSRTAPVAACLAALAWQHGNGPLARIAADHARQCDPNHTLARLVGQAVEQAVAPIMWTDLLNGLRLRDLRESRRRHRGSSG